MAMVRKLEMEELIMKTKCVVLIVFCLMICSAVPAFAGYDHSTCVRNLEAQGLAGPDSVCLPGTFTNSSSAHQFCAPQGPYVPIQGAQCVNKKTGERTVIRMAHASVDITACQMKGRDWTLSYCYTCCAEAN